MACPYFQPVSPLSQITDVHSAILPLGDFWAGECHADAVRPFMPDRVTLKSCCNLGYARGECHCFPAGSGPDAIRFTIREDDGQRLRLHYVVERDHHPFAHGPLEFSRVSGSLLSASADPAIARQARAYVESYLRRKSEA